MGSKQRQSNIELLRILSMVMIVFLHIMNHGGLLDTVVYGTVNYYAFWMIEVLSYVSVNVYVLISGYFLITQKFSLKKLLTILIEVLFYSMLFFTIFVISGRVPFSLKGLALAIVPVKEYWFTRIYIGLYILFPFLNMALLKLSKTVWRALLITLLLLFSLIIPSTALSVSGNGIVWFVTLYVIAAYIRVFGLNIFRQVKVTSNNYL